MVYKTHDDLYEPKPIQQLLRYMNFAKFVALIQSGKLYFPSLINFLQNDPWEGLLPPANYKPDLPIVHIDSGGKSIISTVGELLAGNFTKFISDQKLAVSKLRKTFYANCWHMNDGESDSQWRIYGDYPESIAIVSNFDCIKKSILDDRVIYGSEVKYYNQNSSPVSARNAFHPVVHKRTAFSHEREFRLIFWDISQMNEKNHIEGINVDVDLKVLIQKIIISPRSPNYFLDVVKNVLNQYGFNFECLNSELYQKIE